MTERQTGIIAWFASNPVAANLLMAVIVLGGLFSAFSIQKKTFPDFQTNNVSVTVPVRGGAPEEVEEGVVVKIEEAIADVDGIEHIRSSASEGSGRVVAEVADDFSIETVLDEIKLKVDAISTFPVQAERPIIEREEFQNQVIWLSVYGDLGESARKYYADQVRNELLALPDITLVEVVGDRPYEISIEVSENNLRKYGLTLADVAEAVRRSSLDLPGGIIESTAGDIRLRTLGQAYRGDEFRDIALLTDSNGTRITVGDIAKVNDGFVESQGFARFDGYPALSLRVQSVGDQNDITIAEVVREYIGKKKAELPEGVYLDSWGDSSFYLKGRLEMMQGNILWGALLVFLTLTLFLRLKVAFWVIVGLPVCFLGALWLMPHTPWPVTINMLSLFAFILVLGVVVDDAIIIGESIYSETRARGHNLDNVIAGAHRVAVPATFGVLTTIAAFAPMLFISGGISVFFEAIAIVVILCLVFSLIESKLILPAHLAHARIRHIPPESRNILVRVQRFFSDGLERFGQDRYLPVLSFALRHKMTTVAVFVSLFILTVGLIAGGVLRMVFFPNVPSDFIQTRLTMVEGTPPSQTSAAIDRLEAGIREVESWYAEEHPEDDRGLVRHQLAFTNGETGGQVVVELTKGETREVDAWEIVRRWREAVGEIPGAKELDFAGGTNAGGGAPINIRLTGDDYELLEAAAGDLENALKEYSGVFDVVNGASSGTREIKLSMKPSAEVLGLSGGDLARQVRQAFYGEEAQRVQRGRDEVRVMVRYPRSERGSVANLERMKIRAPSGAEVPFTSVAEARMGSSYNTINRVDRKRAIDVTADIDREAVEPQRVISDLMSSTVPELQRMYPGVSAELGGSSQEEQDVQREMMIAALAALFLIYALLAIPLKSYVKPLLIMAVIPFGFIGAVAGHLLLGLTLNMMSLFGLLAMAGVVVNDSLILMDFINRARTLGMERLEAARQAGIQRFRPIILTSLTTFAGVVPILGEQSLQARFVIPMAVSLGFGILFATLISLVLVPAMYIGAADLRDVVRRFWHGRPREAAAGRAQ